MEFFANEGKNVEIDAFGNHYLRHAIKTRFIKQGENYIDVFREYVSPIYEEGDIVSCSEKIIALCQNRVILKKDIKVSRLAKFLSRFVNQTPAGESVGNPFKMQIAINLCGRLKVIFAAICAGVGKLFGKKGVFYKIVGPEVVGLDGFCDDAFDTYLDMGIRIPENSDGVCDEIKDKLGISCMIVDANDIGQLVLGKSSDLEMTKEELRELIRDNPAGQGHESTPIILIRKVNQE
jgi:hypothetical protein